MSEILVHDHWVSTEHGKLFARRWTPKAGRASASVPIILLHDSLGCVALWRDFPEHLAAATGLEVIAYDRLGFGRSDHHYGALSPLHFIRDEAQGDFRALREALAVERFIVFGHSVGGGMAVACAAGTTSTCVGLITESAQVFAEDRTLHGIREAKRNFAEPGQLQRLEKYHGEKSTWVLHAWIDSWLAPTFTAWNLDADLRRVRCPVLILHGDDDEYGSTRHLRRIAELVAGPATQHILEGCGHVPHREQEGTVLARIQAWIATLDATS